MYAFVTYISPFWTSTYHSKIFRFLVLNKLAVLKLVHHQNNMQSDTEEKFVSVLQFIESKNQNPPSCQILPVL